MTEKMKRTDTRYETYSLAEMHRYILEYRSEHSFVRIFYLLYAIIRRQTPSSFFVLGKEVYYNNGERRAFNGFLYQNKRRYHTGNRYIRFSAVFQW